MKDLYRLLISKNAPAKFWPPPLYIDITSALEYLVRRQRLLVEKMVGRSFVF